MAGVVGLKIGFMKFEYTPSQDLEHLVKKGMVQVVDLGALPTALGIQGENLVIHGDGARLGHLRCQVQHLPHVPTVIMSLAQNWDLNDGVEHLYPAEVKMVIKVVPRSFLARKVIEPKIPTVLAVYDRHFCENDPYVKPPNSPTSYWDNPFCSGFENSNGENQFALHFARWIAEGTFGKISYLADRSGWLEEILETASYLKYRHNNDPIRGKVDLIVLDYDVDKPAGTVAEVLPAIQQILSWLDENQQIRLSESLLFRFILQQLKVESLEDWDAGVGEFPFLEYSPREGTDDIPESFVRHCNFVWSWRKTIEFDRIQTEQFIRMGFIDHPCQKSFIVPQIVQQNKSSYFASVEHVVPTIMRTLTLELGRLLRIQKESTLPLDLVSRLQFLDQMISDYLTKGVELELSETAPQSRKTTSYWFRRWACSRGLVELLGSRLQPGLDNCWDLQRNYLKG